jgi:cytochrome b subunit of formate dehydrogenase
VGPGASIAVVFALACLAAAAQDTENKACLACHQKHEASTPFMDGSVLSVSAHGKLDCIECHVGIKQPCQKKMKVTQCKTCHADQTTALSGASHLEKLKKSLDKDGTAKAATVCLSCHGGDVHAVKASTDTKSTSNRANVAATCLQCHQENQHIAVNKYTNSVHGKASSSGNKKAAVCIDCHGSHGIDHSKLATSKVFHTTITETCGKCHPQQKTDYESSTHWAAASKGYREPPVCTDCHGEHGIQSSQDPTSPTFASNITKTCSSCHGSERLTAKFMLKSDRVQSFKSSFHGMSNELGDLRVANCASCHGNHGVLPSSDSRSTVNPANLGKTCGSCHPSASTRFISERIHSTLERPSHWLVSAVRLFYIGLIVVVISSMLGHNLLDLIYKATKGMPYHRQPGLDLRFTVNERIQHAFLALSFIMLAVSGFALKFPDSPLAWPFQIFNATADVRRWSHRGAAIVFGVLSVYHLIYMIATKRGREQFQRLRPTWQDAKDVKDVLLRYIRRHDRVLHLPPFAYTEKAEYWALVWGSIVMAVTGMVLTFVNLSLSNLSLWVVDLAVTIHYWEAVLAGLAILIWHFYWVFFDPEYYPLNLTWLFGNPRPTPAHAKETVHPHEKPIILPKPQPELVEKK